MKRIDLHIHTIASPLDSPFEYNQDALVEHINNNELDAIAITNHNKFDMDNYHYIKDTLSDITVFPGIEVSVNNFHVLVIADPDDVQDFNTKCKNLPEIKQDESSIDIEMFRDLFGSNKYIIIAHYMKNRAINEKYLMELDDIITALEVSSPKKWMQAYNNVNKPIVLFSDFRADNQNKLSIGKYTYISTDNLDFNAIKLTFNDKDKFGIGSKIDKFELRPNLIVSSHLNVVIGKRSSGKTYLLDVLNTTYDPLDVKYIKQFDIVNDANDVSFKNVIEEEDKNTISSYYHEMKIITDKLKTLKTKEESLQSINTYINNLKYYADYASIKDIFSKCPIYEAAKLPLIDSDNEEKVLKAIITLLEDEEFNDEINSIIGINNLIKLFDIILNEYKTTKIKIICRNIANDILEKIKTELSINSSSPICPTSPIIDYVTHTMIINRMATLMERTKDEIIIEDKDVIGFRRIVKRTQYKNATELKQAIKTNESLANIYSLQPAEFIEKLLTLNGEILLERAFFKVEIEIVNEHNEKISGGQRAEYLFSKKIKDAKNYDLVLIDEPESSFDNPFLNEKIIHEVKNIAKSSTVFLVTHNNILGLSSKPDSIIYTEVNPDGVHETYAGEANGEYLTSSDGKSVKRSEIVMLLMEAGSDSYNERKNYYENS